MSSWGQVVKESCTISIIEIQLNGKRSRNYMNVSHHSIRGPTGLKKPTGAMSSCSVILVVLVWDSIRG